MSKPTPKQEIVINSMPSIETLTIYVSTADMAEWVRKEAPQFGSLIESSHGFILNVNPCFDTDEVAIYLRGE